MSSGWNGVWSYVDNRQFYSHFWDGITLYTTLDTATTRNILTTVFIVLNFIIGIVGAFFCKKRNLRRLNTRWGGDKPIPISHLTSWMSLYGIWKYWWSTRRFPGGRYVLAMLLIGIFGLAHQYFVNSFILRVYMQEICTFDIGTIYSPSNISLGPSSTWSVANTVYNAQYDVWSNNAIFGIYNKINYTSNTFSPTADDVVGNWNCTSLQNTTISSADRTSSETLLSYLATENFLFPEAFYLAGAIIQAENVWGGFLAWSADQPDDSTEQWNVRATVGVDLSGSTAPVTNLDCHLQLKTGVAWQPMPSNSTLAEWAPKTFGVLANSGADSYGFYTEWMLNGMAMVAASGNNDQWLPSELPAGTSTSYGCIEEGTVIEPQIWAILAAIFLILVSLFVLIVKDSFLLFFKRGGKHAQLAEVAPSWVQDWQQVLLRQSMNDDTIALSEIHRYSYGWSNTKDRFVLGLNSSFEPRVLPTTVDIEIGAGKEAMTP